ncbi:hypothetical protein [Pedobacter cryoconitis]|uniref:Uncharacterized protein n=1 Tax=Pedobacter cryoconitis TaxID=188932 RepID=A0A327T6J2_9SPHI|nr:hypothetical protein [Pedobacter cryoconitis]RAJ37236.1 hypothetical protein LY11_00312 [Pedobacter cryoconitis]
MGTIYDNFNSELQALEKSKPQDALQQYSRLKQKYAGQLTFTDSTYNLKCTGVRESFLANKDGIVKIGDEFIHFGVNGYETFKASAGKGYAGSVKVDAINGSQPNANSLTVTAGNYGMTSQGNGQFYARVKLYNIHTGAGGYRGFVALECYARHKNWIGIWADRKSLVGISGAVDLELIKGAANNPVSSTPFNALIGGSVFPPPPLGTPTPGTGNENLTERYEVVLALSQYLKTNAQPIFNVGNNIELGSNPAIVNDDFLQPLGYWKTAKSVEFKIPFAYTPIKINAMSGFDLLTNNITYPELILNF